MILPSHFFSLFFFPFFIFFSFFPSFFSFLLFLPLSIDFFKIWLFSFLSHGHVSSHGPSIMCHMSLCESCAMCHMNTCFRWHLPHHMTFLPYVFFPWCHVAVPGLATYYLICQLTLEKCEISIISEFNEIRLGN